MPGRRSSGAAVCIGGHRQVTGVVGRGASERVCIRPAGQGERTRGRGRRGPRATPLVLPRMPAQQQVASPDVRRSARAARARRRALRRRRPSGAGRPASRSAARASRIQLAATAVGRLRRVELAASLEDLAQVQVTKGVLRLEEVGCRRRPWHRSSCLRGPAREARPRRPGPGGMRVRLAGRARFEGGATLSCARQSQREAGVGRGRPGLELERRADRRPRPPRPAGPRAARRRGPPALRPSRKRRARPLGRLASRGRAAQPGLRAGEGREALRVGRRLDRLARRRRASPPRQHAGRSVDWSARTRARTATASTGQLAGFRERRPASSSRPSRVVRPRERQRRLRVARRLRGRLLEDLDRFGLPCPWRAGPPPS